MFELPRLSEEPKAERVMKTLLLNDTIRFTAVPLFSLDNLNTPIMVIKALGGVKVNLSSSCFQLYNKEDSQMAS